MNCDQNKIQMNSTIKKKNQQVNFLHEYAAKPKYGYELSFSKLKVIILFSHMNIMLRLAKKIQFQKSI